MATAFDIERDFLKSRIWFERGIQAFLGLSAIVSLSTPFLTPTRQEQTGLLWSYSLVSSVGFSLVSALKEKQEKFYSSLLKNDLTLIKEELQAEGDRQGAISEIENTRELVSYLNQLPEKERIPFALKYDLIDFINLPEKSLEIPNSILGLSNDSSISNIQMVQNAPKTEPTANISWLIQIAKELAEPNPDKRKHHHIMVNGGSQSGKSTVVSSLILLLNQELKKHDLKVAINLIDPKYPKTRWIIEPSSKGYEEVLAGITTSVSELAERKQKCLNSRKERKPDPVFNFYLSIVDEQDNIYGGGKGYEGVISPQEASSILGYEKRIIKEGAAYNMCAILIGQSPLSGASGLTRHDYSNITQIVLGIEALKWVQDAGFPFKKQREKLEDELLFWIDQAEKAATVPRVALVLPNMGSPFVVPLSSELKELVNQFSQQDPEQLILEWIISQKERPSNEDLKQKWFEITGEKLSDSDLKSLKIRFEIDD